MDRYALYGKHERSDAWQFLSVGSDPSSLELAGLKTLSITITDPFGFKSSFPTCAIRVVRETFRHGQWIIREVLAYREIVEKE